MTKNRLYTLVLAGAALGYGWVAWNDQAAQATLPDVCLFRRVTGIPCPACGSTHAVVQLFHLHFGDALWWNPLGYVIAAAMIIFPVWILTDLLRGSQSFFVRYQKAEMQIRQPKLAIPLVLLVLTEWIWNLLKNTL